MGKKPIFKWECTSRLLLLNVDIKRLFSANSGTGQVSWRFSYYILIWSLINLDTIQTSLLTVQKQANHSCETSAFFPFLSFCCIPLALKRLLFQSAFLGDQKMTLVPFVLLCPPLIYAPLTYLESGHIVDTVRFCHVAKGCWKREECASPGTEQTCWARLLMCLPHHLLHCRLGAVPPSVTHFSSVSRSSICLKSLQGSNPQV